MEEVSGSTINDFSGNNRTLTIIGTPNWVSDFPPTSNPDTTSLSFDGSNYGQLVSAGDLLAFDFSSAFTLEAWVKTSAVNDPGVVAKWDGGNGYMMWFTGGSTAKVENKIDPGSSVAGLQQVNDGFWHHLAITWNGTDQAVYVDGILDNLVINTGSTPNSSGRLFRLGAYGNSADSGTRFIGLIDEVKIWNVARTQSEIQADGGITVIPTQTPTPTITPTPTPTGAQVFLNEFMPHPTNDQDWVEIVNVGAPTDISSWLLEDLTGVFHTFPSGTILASNGLSVVTQFERLNNGGDTITLKDSGDSIIDTKSYVGLDVILDKSIGRNPDGVGPWKTCNISSQSVLNNFFC